MDIFDFLEQIYLKRVFPVEELYCFNLNCAKCLVLPIIFHIHSFFMLDNNGNTSPCDNQAFSHIAQSLQLDDSNLWLLWKRLTFNCISHLMVCMLIVCMLIVHFPILKNTLLCKVSWHLRVAQPLLWFCINQVYRILSQCAIFVSSTNYILVSP